VQLAASFPKMKPNTPYPTRVCMDWDEVDLNNKNKQINHLELLHGNSSQGGEMAMLCIAPKGSK